MQARKQPDPAQPASATLDLESVSYPLLRQDQTGQVDDRGRRARVRSPSERLVREGLSPDRCLEHQSLLTDSEHMHPIPVLGVRLRPCLEPNRRRLPGKLHIPALEAVERGLVLERDDLRIDLAAEGQADRCL